MAEKTPSRRDSSTPKGTPSHGRRRWPWWPVAAAALAALAIAPVLVLRPDAADELTYGEFRQAVLQGRVARAVLGPSEITGTLRAEQWGGRPEPFRTSRRGIEDKELPALLDRQGVRYAAEPGPGAAEQLLVPLVFVAGVAGLLVYVARKGGFGSAMAFARSKHRIYGGESVPVTFEDVAGVDEAVAELREVVDFLKTPERFRAIGGRIPKGILLVGPPGTGKTLLARAVAGEADVPFFNLSGSDFMEMFVGVGAARVRSLFDQAKAAAPCLIFIDEIDAIGKARSAGGAGGASDERDQTLNQLLVSMDGFDSNQGIVVLAATNRPETLDAALVRPGRFDRNVVIDRPNIDGREKILRVHSRRVPIGEEINLRHIAAMTPGFVGAELANLVNEAALLAARKGKTTVDRLEFEEGVERVLAGPERKQKILRPDEQRRIAVHEAGHALVSRSLPGTDPVHKVSIVGRGNGMGGFTMYRPEDDRFLHTQSWLRHHICGLLGGTLAEEVLLGEISDGATSDLQRATQIARKMVTDFGMSPLGRVSYQAEGRSPFLPGGGAPGDASWSPETAREIDLEVRRILEDCLHQTRRIIERRRAALEEITELLLRRETIDAAELQAILDAHPDRA
jgi:cell division protease FtsH